MITGVQEENSNMVTILSFTACLESGAYHKLTSKRQCNRTNSTVTDLYN